MVMHSRRSLDLAKAIRIARMIDPCMGTRNLLYSR